MAEYLGIETIEKFCTVDKKNNSLFIQEFEIDDFVSLYVNNIRDKNFQSVVIFADTIHLQHKVFPDFSIDLSHCGNLTLVCRKFISDIKVYVENSNNKNKNDIFKFYSQSLNVKSFTIDTDEEGISPILLTEKNICAEFQINTKLVQSKIEDINELWSINKEQYWLFFKQFQNAFSLLNKSKKEAKSVFKWIVENTKKVFDENRKNEILLINKNAMSMYSNLQIESDKFFVPKLSLQESLNMIKSSSNLLEETEKLYINLNSSHEIEKYFEYFTIEKIDSSKQIIHLTQEKITLSKETLKAKIKELYKNKKNLDKQYANITRYFKKLKNDIAQKEEESKNKFLISTTINIIKFTKNVLSENVPGAITNLGDEFQEIVSIINKIEYFTTMLNKLENIKDNDFNELENYETIDMSSYNTEWENFYQYFKLKLEQFKKFDYFNELLYSIKMFKIYGQTINLLQYDIFNLNSNLLINQSKINFETHNLDNLVNIKKEMISNEEKNERLKNSIKQSYFNIKRQFLIDIYNFDKAFYFLFYKFPQNDFINYSTPILKTKFITYEKERAIKNELEKVKNYSTLLIVNYIYTLSFEEKNKLKIGEKISIEINMNNKIFNGWERFRVNSVKSKLLGLEDIKSNVDLNAVLIIENSGIFKDKKESFVSLEPLKVPYSYSIDNSVISNKSQILSDNSKNTYSNNTLSNNYKPSIFTTWIVSLPRNIGENMNFDYSKINRVYFEFNVEAKLCE